MVGLDDRRGIFQPERFYDSMLLPPSRATRCTILECGVHSQTQKMPTLIGSSFAYVNKPIPVHWMRKAQDIVGTKTALKTARKQPLLLYIPGRIHHLDLWSCFSLGPAG